MTTRTDYHIEIATEFLVRAHAYLADDDLLQASEKGLGSGGAGGEGGRRGPGLES